VPALPITVVATVYSAARRAPSRAARGQLRSPDGRALFQCNVAGILDGFLPVHRLVC
jgi:hypothetical protein